MVNAVPLPTSLSASMDPPCSSTIRWQIASPSPVPSPTGFVVKKGLNILSRISAGIPGPVSETTISICDSPPLLPAFAAALIVTLIRGSYVAERRPALEEPSFRREVSGGLAFIAGALAAGLSE